MNRVTRRQTYVAIWALLVKTLVAMVNMMRTMKKRTQRILFTALIFRMCIKWPCLRHFSNHIGFVMSVGMLIAENKCGNEEIEFDVSLVVKVIFFKLPSKRHGLNNFISHSVNSIFYSGRTSELLDYPGYTINEAVSALVKLVRLVEII